MLFGRIDLFLKMEIVTVVHLRYQKIVYTAIMTISFNVINSLDVLRSYEARARILEEEVESLKAEKLKIEMDRNNTYKEVHINFLKEAAMCIHKFSRYKLIIQSYTLPFQNERYMTAYCCRCV